MKIAAILSFLLTLCATALAQTLPARTVKITVGPPTQYEDGTAIPAGKTITYNTYVGACNATLTRVGSGVGTLSTAPNVTPGQCIAAEAVVDGATGAPTQIIYHGKPGSVSIFIVTE